MLLPLVHYVPPGKEVSSSFDLEGFSGGKNLQSCENNQTSDAVRMVIICDGTLKVETVDLLGSPSSL